MTSIHFPYATIIVGENILWEYSHVMQSPSIVSRHDQQIRFTDRHTAHVNTRSRSNTWTAQLASPLLTSRLMSTFSSFKNIMTYHKETTNSHASLLLHIKTPFSAGFPRFYIRNYTCISFVLTVLSMSICCIFIVCNHNFKLEHN